MVITESDIILGELEIVAYICPNCKRKIREIEECEICDKIICDLCIDHHYQEEHYEA